MQLPPRDQNSHTIINMCRRQCRTDVVVVRWRAHLCHVRRTWQPVTDDSWYRARDHVRRIWQRPQRQRRARRRVASRTSYELTDGITQVSQERFHISASEDKSVKQFLIDFFWKGSYATEISSISFGKFLKKLSIYFYIWYINIARKIIFFFLIYNCILIVNI